MGGWVGGCVGVMCQRTFLSRQNTFFCSSRRTFFLLVHIFLVGARFVQSAHILFATPPRTTPIRWHSGIEGEGAPDAALCHSAMEALCKWRTLSRLFFVF